MTGAALTVKCLLEQGVRDIFGYPGASVLPLFEAAESEKKLSLYVNTDEKFCAFAANGYSRASGRTGVCIATSGPGATNLVTAVADAYMDSIPLVAVTGNVPLRLLGTDAFQEVDIAGVTMPVTKYNFIVKSVESLIPTLRSAFRIANEGRKGPVLVDVPCDIFTAGAKYIKPAAVPREEQAEPHNLRAVAELINASSRPAVCAGGGVIASGASANLRALVERLDCPVVTTAMGIGAFDSTDPRCRGLVGMNISGDASEVLDESDLLIAVGVRFSDRMLCALRGRSLKVVHIDIDDAEIDKNLSPCGALVGDADAILKMLLPLVDTKRGAGFAPRAEGAKNAYSLLNEYFPDAVFTTEVGLHQVEACKKLAVKRPRGFLTSGGLGAMGFGLPAAVGASVALGGKRVVNIAGDGSFMMNMQELATASRYGLPIVELVMNNRSLGMIEKMAGGGRGYCETPCADYSLLARSLGAECFSAQNLAELEAAFASAARINKTVLIDYKMQELI